MRECLGGKPIRIGKPRLPEPVKGRKAGRALASWPVPSKSVHAGTRKVVNYACAG